MSQLKQKKRQNQINQSCSWMSEALHKLMKREIYKDISIAKIVKKAGVSRQTFYRHFKTKEELINWRMEQTFANYIERLKLLSHYDIRKDIILVFEMMKRDEDFLNELFKADLEYLLLKKLTSFTYDLEAVYEFDSKRSLQYVSDYFAGGFFMITLRWIKEGTPETVEEMADLILERCFTNNYNSMKRKPLSL